jgi:erythromycin esterase
LNFPEEGKMKKQFLLGILGIFIVLAFACGKKSAPSEPTTSPEINVAPEIVTWLKQNAIPFNTSKSGSGFNDLMPLKQIIGDARIVALGEATHGTKEFFEMKHRLLEFLVKEMGFNTFAIEATWPESYLVNDYVHTGAGDPALLLAGLYFWTWNTQEVLDMIKWMRAHNQNPGGAPKVSFFGFDMQFPTMAMQNVIAYLQKVDPPRAIWADSLFLPFWPYARNGIGYDTAPFATKTQCRENLQKVYDHLSSHRLTYEAQSSPVEFARALQSARVAQQGEDHYTRSAFVRDRYMAENIGWLLDQAGPDAKIVLWAHNYHVSVASNGPSMGWHLRNRYGSEMVIFGFSFYQGSFNAFSYSIVTGQYGSLTAHRAIPPPTASYEYHFRGAEIDRMFINLRQLQPSAATNWIFGPRPMRSIGAIYDAANPNRFFYDARLPEEFDAMIYFRETSPSVLLSF